MIPPFHESLRAANRAAWEAMLAHPFVRAVESGELSSDAFVRYLSYERDFVITAIPIFAHALLKAPSLAAQRHLIGLLHALANDQVTYFDAAFQALEATPIPTADFPPAVAAFRDGMHEIARTGSYAEIMTAMLAAEWMYATWCQRAAARRIADPRLAQWIALHAAPEFQAGVTWIMGEVDSAAEPASAEEHHQLALRFGETLRLEFDFHSAPLNAERRIFIPSPPRGADGHS